MEKRGWIHRLGVPPHVAPDVARGVRGAIATLVPFYLARKLGSSELAWAALGGWLCTISDPGGARSSRAATLLAFTLVGALLVAIGEAAAATAITAVLVLALAGFMAALLRAIGATGTALGIPFAVVAAIAVATRPPNPIPDALGFAAGAAWALVLSSVLWPIWTSLPLRIALADVWRALGRYVDAVGDAVREELPWHHPRWAEIARTHQRAVRDAIEAAHAAALAIRARRSAETAVGRNLVALLGASEAQYRLLIAFANEVEEMDPKERRANLGALLEALASRYERIAAAVAGKADRNALRWLDRPAIPAMCAGSLGHRLVDGCLAAANVAASPGRGRTDNEVVPSSAGGVLREHIRALRDALSARSTYLRHAVRVTIAVVAAQVIGSVVSPDHVAWVTVTTVAVLQPYPGVTVTRAVERGLGTLLGGIVAVVLIVLVRSPMVLSLSLIPLGIAAVATRPRSHRLFVFFLTPLFVLLAERWQGDWWTAAARVGDALVGATIALVAALVFPSREQPRLVDALRALSDAIRRYADVVIVAHVKGCSGAPEVLAVRRDVSSALATAETSLDRALSEPLCGRHAGEEALVILTYARRLTNALTSLDVAHESAADPKGAFVVLAYVHSVRESILSGRQAPRPPDLDRSVSSRDLLMRIVRQAERLGTRRLPPRLRPAYGRRGLGWASPSKLGFGRTISR